MSSNIQNRWDSIPYPNKSVTSLGVCPDAGSWPLYYFKRDSNGEYKTLDGKKVCFNIKMPEENDGFNTYQLDEVIKVNQNLTEQQKAIASYWGLGVPQNKFIAIEQCLINTYAVNPISATRIYSILDTALNDAMVMCWNYKYKYQIPRPVQYNNDFKPFLITPQHPTYPAGHSVFAGCVYRILSFFFPTESKKIESLCKECSISRLYAGVHFRMDIEEGYKLGVQIAEEVIKQIENDSDSYGATSNFIFTQDRDSNLKPPSYVPIDFCGEKKSDCCNTYQSNGVLKAIN